MTSPPKSSAAPKWDRSVWGLMAVLCGVLFLDGLDVSMVGMALPSIDADLGLTTSSLQWIVSGYVLGYGGFLLLGGRAADLLGRRRMLLIALAVFTVASALGGLVNDGTLLVVTRFLKGASAAFTAPAGLSIITTQFAEGPARNRALSIYTATGASGFSFGLVLGGVLTDTLGWHWIFFVNLPIGAAALGLIVTSLHLPFERSPVRVDVAGAALLTGAITCVLLVTTWGGREYAWDSAEILGLGAGAVALLAGFVVQERRAAEPILPLRLFREPVFVVVSAVLILTTVAFFAAVVFMPLFLQAVTGADATGSGLLLLPLMLAGTLSTAVSGRVISRTGRYKAFPVAGLGLMAIGLFLLSGMDASTSQATASMLLVIFGVGFGMVSQVLTLAIQNAVERRDLGIATASANLFRSLGGSVGVAVFGAIFAARLDVWLPREVPSGARGVNAEGLQASPDTLASLPAAVQHGIGEAVAHSLHTVFLVAAPVAAVGLLVALTLKEVPLRGPAAA